MLADAFGRVREVVDDVVDGLDAEALAFRPDAEANSIAWLVWHLSRIEDAQVAELADREQVWFADGWCERFDLPLEPGSTGYGHSAEDVAAVQVEDPALLAGYQAAAAEACVDFVTGIEASELDRIVDRRFTPPVSVGVRLVSIVDDALQHAGQAAYVRGLLDRR